MTAENFDLNLIRVFIEVAKCRNVTKAALHLGLTQSSVSHSLARLRAICHDQLFVRTSEGMLPTMFASRMIEPFEQALALVGNTLNSPAVFDPAVATRCFNIVLSDLGQLIYLPPLVEYLGRHAHGVTLKVLHLPIDRYREVLEAGDADLALGHLPTLQVGFHQIHLFDDPYVCMLRADHPHFGDVITTEQYLAASHIIVEPPGRGPGLVEQALSRAKKRRNVVLQLPHFFAAPLILRNTDYLLTLPRRVPLALTELNNIRFVPLPFQVPPMSIKLLWHERLHHDTGHRWLRLVIAELFAERPGGGKLVEKND